jgi:hypothetical protein
LRRKAFFRKTKKNAATMASVDNIPIVYIRKKEEVCCSIMANGVVYLFAKY